MRVIGDKNQISEDVFDFMISYQPVPRKLIRSELAKLFSTSIFSSHRLRNKFLQLILISFDSATWELASTRAECVSHQNPN